MPVYRLGSESIFPPNHLAEPDGLLAVGGDLSSERLIAAYRAGVFPWYSDGMPLLWWSPDPRFVISRDSFRLGRTVKKELKQSSFQWTLNARFEEVIEGCKDSPRPGQDGTWLTNEMVDAYTQLHREGFCHSVEVWEGDSLVGGLYGVSIGPMFFGESMFSRVNGASKFAFAHFAERLFSSGWQLIDCQIETDHLARFGAFELDRALFLQELERSLVCTRQAGELLLEREDTWPKK